MMLKSVYKSAVIALLSLAAFAANAPTETSPESLLKNGRVDDALSVLNQRVSKSQDDAQAYHLLSRSYFALKNWDQSIKYGEKAVALDPNNSRYHLWLGRAYGRKAENAGFITAASLAGKMRNEFEKAVALN